ncbi:MAG: chromo domain-containing protein, partial [Candidatus Thiodiazotropha taylori]|nr:chromo domain-containing protein [Candidatus Thiodiazotropha taylori]MCW4285946.1 chromo domain-containing protein [Candidatus Thiodiazotropha taylori]
WEQAKKKNINRQFKFKVGQTVRISHVRSLFDREYSQKWTGEIFSIGTRYRREGLPVYSIVDWDNERIKGTFYEQELQAVNVDPSTEYHIETILKKRTRNKKKEVLVRWLHWPKKYDSWILEAEVKNFQ